MLIKNNFSEKAVSLQLGHAKEIITVDVYCDNEEIISDCSEELEPFIEKVAPPKNIKCDFEDDDAFDNLEEFVNTICL